VTFFAIAKKVTQSGCYIECYIDGNECYIDGIEDLWYFILKGGEKMTCPCCQNSKEEKKEKLIGQVTHYFNKIGVGVIELTDGDLKVGETIHIKGATTDFTQEVKSMQIDKESIQEAKKGQAIGLKVEEPVRENDKVYKVE